MCNKKNQGKDFNWNNFIDIANRRCDVMSYIGLRNLNLTKCEKEEAMITIKEFSKEIAESYIKKAGFNEI